jgi:hypothetical protein
MGQPVCGETAGLAAIMRIFFGWSGFKTSRARLMVFLLLEKRGRVAPSG